MRDELDEAAGRGVSVDDGGSFETAFDKTIAAVETEVRHLNRSTVAAGAIRAKEFDGARGVGLREGDGREKDE